MKAKWTALGILLFCFIVLGRVLASLVVGFGLAAIIELQMEDSANDSNKKEANRIAKKYSTGKITIVHRYFGTFDWDDSQRDAANGRSKGYFSKDYPRGEYMYLYHHGTDSEEREAKALVESVNSAIRAASAEYKQSEHSISSLIYWFFIMAGVFFVLSMLAFWRAAVFYRRWRIRRLKRVVERRLSVLSSEYPSEMDVLRKVEMSDANSVIRLRRQIERQFFTE
jgi:hypothetical protein